MGKKKQKDRELSRQPWWKRAWTIFGLIPISTILAVYGSIYTYKTTGVDELRINLYQPLYKDLSNIEESLQTASIEKPPIFKALPEVRQTGIIERAPGFLQRRLLKVFDEAPSVHTAALAVNEVVIREMSARIIQIRTEKADRIWLQKTSSALREMSTSKKGISDSVMLFRDAKHSARSQSIDIRDPNKPVISGPGGPIFAVNDWLGYPGSIKTIEVLWKDIDYLYFNETRDLWYYRLTREDLKQSNTTLDEFLKPVHEILRQNPGFQLLLNHRSVLLSEISDIKVVLTDRIRDPKQLSDLFSR